MTVQTLTRLLVAAATDTECAALERDAVAAGLGVVGTSIWRTLVRVIPEMEPDGVLLRAATPSAELFETLAEWAPRAPCPVIVFVDRCGAAQTRRAIELGVHAWVVGDYAPARLPAVAQLAQARWRRDTTVHQQLDEARRQLDERKWVERAKGVLMASRELDEDEAYRLLRGAAMQRQARMGDVSRTVIDASHWAEAVNRAGQLRMLSQCLVRVFAQRLARVAVRRAGGLQDEAMQRARENIARLELLVPEPLRDPAWVAVVRAWQALQAVIEGRLSAGAVAQADRCAEVLLQAAEHLTHMLEVAGGRRALHVVNLSGRQRMLAQRVAKEAMLSVVTGRAPVSASLTDAMQAFDAALNELERAPLSSDLIRGSLAAAREEWGRMVRSAATAGQSTDLVACAAACDALVQIFDRLTEHYQRSLHALMG